jgi:uncharacterized protein involved in exopolysaccharide biosynthesis
MMPASARLGMVYLRVAPIGRPWVQMIATVLLALCAGPLVLAGEAEKTGEGLVVRATGIGRPPKTAQGAQARLMAERAAETVALRNLALKLGQARLEGGGRSVIQVEAFLSGYRLAETKYLPDGTVECTVEIPLDKVYGNVVRILQTQLEEARQKQSDTEAKLGAAQTEIGRLSAELAAAKARADEAAKAQAAAADRAAAQISALSAQVADLRTQLNDLKARVNTPTTRS